jgi:tetratricopeptide (TPR) repeat protein
MSARQLPLVALAITMSITLIPSAPGQYQVGGGTALDADLRVSGSGINAPTRTPNFAARNAVITRNVAGGRGFRGSVGYTAAGDFRAPVGSDDLFDFRADSAWSDVNFINLGSTYQRLRFGQDVALLEYDRTYQVRNGDDGLTPIHRVYRPNQVLSARMRLDRINTASSLLQDESPPLFVGTIQRLDEQGEPVEDEQGNPVYDLMRSSPLLGLDRRPVGQAPEVVGLSAYDVARVLEDRMAGRETSRIAEPFSYRFEDLRADSTKLSGEPEDSRSEGERVETKVAVTKDEPFRRILERIEERQAAADEESASGPAQGEADELQTLDARFDAIRRRLAGVETPDVDRPEMPVPPEAGSENPLLPGIEQEPAANEGDGEDEIDLADVDPTEAARAREQEEVDALLRDFSVTEIAAMLRHGERIDALASADQSRFNELMHQAEEALKAGEYFRAERRFIRALRFTPGHPLATIGLAHAQIGSGAYHSASLTLRSLFTYQPEMIDARYSETLKPNRPRLAIAVETLEKRLKRDETRAGAAFLLAYVGRLLEDRDLVERSLQKLEEISPDDRLLPLLRSIWLADDGDAVDEAPSEN